MIPLCLAEKGEPLIVKKIGGTFNENLLKETINGTGYTFVSISCQPYERRFRIL